MKLETKIIAREILKTLYRNGKTLGTAESCTGGRIAEAIISVPGASKYFKGGIISYDNEVKESLLQVSHEVIESQTAVCEEVAAQMHARHSCWHDMDWLWLIERGENLQADRRFRARYQPRCSNKQGS